MQFFMKFVLLQIVCNKIILITAEWCINNTINWNEIELRRFRLQKFNSDSRPLIVCCDGYTKGNNNNCEPVCNIPCPENSHCIEPNICGCNEGYSGDSASAFTIQCLPVCQPGCRVNSQCSKPNKCECSEGYKNIDENICEPVCEDACSDNAICSEPNKCSCLKGYKMLDNHCQPMCDLDCPNYSNCRQPNTCACEAGYQQKLTSTYNLYCEPVCQSNCSTFGKCVQPNKCECLDGYEMDEMEVCQPICSSGCQNGLCYQPEVCICHPGYLMGPNKQCEPVCSLTCQNSLCVEPEICQCSEGFKFKEGSINVCEPVCEPSCINGICVGPQICICHENYEPIAGDKGLNHSNCQLRQITTTTVESSNEYTSAASEIEESTEMKILTDVQETQPFEFPWLLISFVSAVVLVTAILGLFVCLSCRKRSDPSLESCAKVQYVP